MVGTKPSAYLSEEARLEAQRRMLAERYGLGVSDDEGEDENEGEDQEEKSEEDATGVSTSETRTARADAKESVHQTGGAATGKDTSANGFSSPHQNEDDASKPAVTLDEAGETGSDLAGEEPAPSEAATYGDGSSIHDDLVSLQSHDETSLEASNSCSQLTAVAMGTPMNSLDVLESRALMRRGKPVG